MDSDAVAVVVASFAVLVSTFFSVRSLRLARRSLEVAQQDYNAARAEAWDYLGAQQCSAYREQVLALYEKGLGEPEIEQWFRLERGGAENPHSHEGHADGYEALADGCGTVRELLDLLPPKKPATGPPELA